MAVNHFAKLLFSRNNVCAENCMRMWSTSTKIESFAHLQEMFIKMSQNVSFDGLMLSASEDFVEM